MFGIDFKIILAITIYMFSLVIVTEFLKKFLLISPLILSWLIGFILYAIITLVGIYEFNFESIIYFAFITGLLNTVYKFTKLKNLIKKIVLKKY